MPFREDATRIAVLITDARGGGFDDRYVAGEDDVAAREVANLARQRDVRIAGVFVPTPQSATYQEVARQMTREYPRITGGVSGRSRRMDGGPPAILEVLRACGAAPLLGGDQMGRWVESAADLLDSPMPYLMAVAIVVGLLGLLVWLLQQLTVRNWGMHLIQGATGLAANVLTAVRDVLAGWKAALGGRSPTGSRSGRSGPPLAGAPTTAARRTGLAGRALAVPRLGADDLDPVGHPDDRLLRGRAGVRWPGSNVHPGYGACRA